MKKFKLALSSLSILIVSLLLFTSHNKIFAATYTWAGTTSASMNLGTNWTPNGVPVNGDSLIFDNTSGSTNIAVTYDLASNVQIAGITFTGSGNSGFLISGTNIMNLTGTITDTYSGKIGSVLNFPITITGNKTISVPLDHYLFFGGDLTGAGNLTLSGTGSVAFDGDNSANTGQIIANAGTLIDQSSKALATSGGTIVNTGADLVLGVCSSTTYLGDITISGPSSAPTVVPKITSGATCAGATTTEVYGQPLVAGVNNIMSGNLVLSSDITFGGIAEKTTISGALSGNFTINMLDGYGGSLIISNSSSTKLTNGTYTSKIITKTISDSFPLNSVSIFNSTITIDGKRGDTIVFAGGILMGGGQVGALNILNGGNLSPGHSPGCISSGNLTLAGTYNVEIGGNTACSGYDQMKVTGTVDLTGGSLNALSFGGFVPKAGDKYTIIDNDGSDAVTGTFTGLAEGASITVGGKTLTVSYVGGDGNDVVLSAAAAAPVTGMNLIVRNSLLQSFSVILIASVTVGLIGIKQLSSNVILKNKK